MGEMSISWPVEAKRIGPGLEFLKMLPNNRRIQSGEEESDGFDRSYGKSRLTSPEPEIMLIYGGGMGNRFEISCASGRRRKANSFYDDVMQGIFSIFFSFLLLPSL
jgi:hypothetical protein